MNLRLTTPSDDHDHDARIREAQLAVISRMEAAPEMARSTLRTCGEIGDGLSCRIKQGKFEATLDLGPGMGGGATGPSPGFFGRAAIAGCVAIAIKMHAAREGLRFSSVAVAVDMDFDDAALFGIGTGSAAPLETRICIEIATEVDQAVVSDLVSSVLEMDPWFLALRDPQRVSSQITTMPPAPSQ